MTHNLHNSAEGKNCLVRGFMLLPPNPIYGYYGVDRQLFEPLLLDEEIDPLAQVVDEESRIWVFYPPGWRRDAYRLYEENLVKAERYDLGLLSDVEVARKIQLIIKPHIGPYKIVFCEVWEIDSVQIPEDTTEPGFLGYDIAYPGGDFYSAVLNGLLKNPHPALVTEYKLLLNEFGLFLSTRPIQTYIRRFRDLVPSEVDAEFCVFRLVLQPSATAAA